MKAYVFDLDGTLLDSMRLWEQIDLEFLNKRGLEVPADYIDAICSRSFPEAAAYTIERFGLSESVEDLLKEWQDMAAYAYGNTVEVKPNAREYLHELKKRGMLLAVATSLPASLYEPTLRNHDIYSLFDVICSTAEVSHGKTRPDIFYHVASKLGVSTSDCVMFEDIQDAIMSAKTAGMTVYAVYDEVSKSQWEETKKLADGAILDFKDAPLPE